MSRFDPEPDEPYGICEICETPVADREAMSAHFAETRQPNGHSHRVRITNQTRADRIESEIEQLAEDALYEWVNSVSELSDEGVTEAEITEGIRGITSSFDGAWEKRDE